MYKQINAPNAYLRRSSDKPLVVHEDVRFVFRKFFSDEKLIAGLISDDRNNVLATCSILLRQIKLEPYLSSCEEKLHSEIRRILLDEQALSTSDFIGQEAGSKIALSTESKIILLNFLSGIGNRDILREVAMHSSDEKIASTSIWGLYRIKDVEGLCSIVRNAVSDKSRKCAERAIHMFGQKTST